MLPLFYAMSCQTLLFCQFYRTKCYLISNMKSNIFFIRCQIMCHFLESVNITDVVFVFPCSVHGFSSAMQSSLITYQRIFLNFPFISQVYVWKSFYWEKENYHISVAKFTNIYFNNTYFWVNIEKNIENITKNPVMGI